MKYSSIILITICLVSNSSYGQTCNCEQNFSWVKKTFEENDAGYQDIIALKGKQAYTTHTDSFIQKIKGAKTTTACASLMNEWIHFFRKGHIGVFPADDQDDNDTNAHWEKTNINLQDFKNHLYAEKTPGYEGIWDLNNDTIGIIKEKNQYTGFIIKSGNISWKQNEVKLKFTKSTDGDRLLFYTGNRSTEEYKNVELIGNNYLQAGGYVLKRVFPEFKKDDKGIEAYYKRMTAKQPYAELLNDKTVYFRIPSFNPKYKKSIDSVILKCKSKILTTETLIIDLLDNGGGVDESYQELLPILYTNPLRNIAVARRSSKLNNQALLDGYNNPEYGFSAEDKKWAKQAYDKLESQLGKFVNLGDSTIYIEKRDSVYPYPKNVGILINEHNGSTAEQFLLDAKQSKKVKLFGRMTFGALDMSNLNFAKSPSNCIVLVYAMSRSFRIPEMPVDDIGIQPDYYLDKTIPLFKWVEYVNEILNTK
ncbi:hypothetical protein T231_04000 [Tannerella sp. oral taxon BU063 isolate Cell 6/7/9]|uniref:Tail specific protease domain-containing protein n=1 Tax=Tannerella sp. oral taxon BU063 isolate Cell 6/7/9 TaxID=1411021 RepID=W2CVS3_9BACT|nr:hypothetical protein T231_04000 [Tannerella sp. oral taxon BU063 isolate Cell 6/7/9]